MDVIIAPNECKKLLRVKLPRPQDGQAQHFFHDEDNLAIYEAIKFSDKYRSWFLDNLLCQDGHYNMMTKVDPIFILLPHIMRQARDKFRPLDDICQEFSANQATDAKPKVVAGNNEQDGKFDRLETALAPGINWSNVCDTQEIDGELFVKYSEKRTEEWLMKKHDKLMDVLRDELGSKASKATIMSNATDLICDYVPEEIHEKFKATVRERHTLGNRSN